MPVSSIYFANGVTVGSDGSGDVVLGTSDGTHSVRSQAESIASASTLAQNAKNAADLARAEALAARSSALTATATVTDYTIDTYNELKQLIENVSNKIGTSAASTSSALNTQQRSIYHSCVYAFAIVHSLIQDGVVSMSDATLSSVASKYANAFKEIAQGGYAGVVKPLVDLPVEIASGTFKEAWRLAVRKKMNLVLDPDAEFNSIDEDTYLTKFALAVQTASEKLAVRRDFQRMARQIDDTWSDGVTRTFETAIEQLSSNSAELDALMEEVSASFSANVSVGYPLTEAHKESIRTTVVSSDSVYDLDSDGDNVTFKNLFCDAIQMCKDRSVHDGSALPYHLEHYKTCHHLVNSNAIVLLFDTDNMAAHFDAYVSPIVTDSNVIASHQASDEPVIYYSCVPRASEAGKGSLTRALYDQLITDPAPAEGCVHVLHLESAWSLDSLKIGAKNKHPTHLGKAHVSTFAFDTNTVANTINHITSEASYSKTHAPSRPLGNFKRLSCPLTAAALHKANRMARLASAYSEGLRTYQAEATWAWLRMHAEGHAVDGWMAYLENSHSGANNLLGSATQPTHTVDAALQVLFDTNTNALKASTATTFTSSQMQALWAAKHWPVVASIDASSAEVYNPSIWSEMDAMTREAAFEYAPFDTVATSTLGIVTKADLQAHYEDKWTDFAFNLTQVRKSYTTQRKEIYTRILSGLLDDLMQGNASLTRATYPEESAFYAYASKRTCLDRTGDIIYAAIPGSIAFNKTQKVNAWLDAIGTTDHYALRARNPCVQTAVLYNNRHSGSPSAVATAVRNAFVTTVANDATCTTDDMWVYKYFEIVHTNHTKELITRTPLHAVLSGLHAIDLGDLSSFTSTSSLTNAQMLVVNKACGLRATFSGALPFYTSNSTLIYSLEYSTNGGTSYTAMVLGSIGLAIHDTNKTIDFNFTAGSVSEHRFRMRLRASDGTVMPYTTFTVPVESVYQFPTMSNVTKDVSVITKGETLTCTSNFDAALLSGVVGTVSVTPSGQGSVTATNVSLSGTTYVYSFAVDHDVTYSASITLTMGSVSQSYSWANATTPFTLTGNEIYTFPSAFTYTGTLKEEEDNPMTLTFTGGDMLHSSVVSLQIEYVKWNQGSDNTLDNGLLTCSDPAETITISSLTPMSSSVDLLIKVKLKAPDGTVSSEITLTIPSGDIDSSLATFGFDFNMNNTTATTRSYIPSSDPAVSGVYVHNKNSSVTLANETKNGFSVPITHQDHPTQVMTAFRVLFPTRIEPTDDLHVVAVVKQKSFHAYSHAHMALHDNSTVAGNTWSTSTGNGNHQLFGRYHMIQNDAGQWVKVISRAGMDGSMYGFTLDANENDIFIYDVQYTSNQQKLTVHRYRTSWESQTQTIDGPRSYGWRGFGSSISESMTWGFHDTNQCVCEVKIGTQIYPESTYIDAIKAYWQGFAG